MNTLRMLALYDTMPLVDLVDRFEELDSATATHREGLERRVLDRVVRREASGGAGVRCSLELRMSSQCRIGPAVLVEVEEGGVMVEAEGRWPVGTAVDLEILHGVDDARGLRVRGSVGEVSGTRLRVHLLRPRSEAETWRRGRFVLEALRHRVHWTRPVQRA